MGELRDKLAGAIARVTGDDGDDETGPDGGASSHGGSGRGGPTGEPSHGPLNMRPPSSDQEKNEVVSGGGVVDPDNKDGASSH